MPIDAQVADAVLGRLGLELAGRADVGHQRQVDVERVLLADVLAELADRLEERQALDVADGAADLDDHDVDVAGDGPDAVLDLVGDVRDDLDGPAEVVAAALLLDHRLVDLAGRPVAVAGRGRVGEALVVAEVEVGLGAVVGDEDLAVLVRAHRARVDVDVGVELQQRDREAVAFEQRADRGRGQALAERGDDAAGDEDVLGGTGGVAHDRDTVRLARSRSSAVSTATDTYDVSRTRMGMPCSSARSCSSDSDSSSGRRRQGGQRQQRRPPVGVEADVHRHRRAVGAAAVGNRGAGEVEGAAAAIAHHLDQVGRGRVVVGGERPAQRGHLLGAIGEQRRDQQVEGRRIDQRLVALDVDDDVAGQIGDELGQAIGAGAVVGAGQAGDAAEAFDGVDDPLVVGGDDHRVDVRPGGAPIDVLDHRAAGDVSEGFSGESGGVVAGRDDCHYRRFRQSGRQSAWNSGHGESYHSAQIGTPARTRRRLDRYYRHGRCVSTPRA